MKTKKSLLRLMALFLVVIAFIVPTSCSKKDSTTQIVPTVTTSTISDYAQTTATLGGVVVSDGGATISERGVCYSLSSNPTISDSHTSGGNGTGTFTCNITGLTSKTTYHVRAYAINNVGIGYGEDRTFTTLATPISNSYLDPFDGLSLNTTFWQILDKTYTHEPGLNLYVNNALYIVRGPDNDNNGWYGIESILEYPTFKSAKIDFWLDAVHNWEDHKIGFVTPFGMMGYYNYGAYWWFDYYKSNGDYANFTSFGTSGYNANQKYSFKISVDNGTLKFEWDNGSGLQTVFQTTDFSLYKLFGASSAYKKVNILNDDRGKLQCDNFELYY